MDRMFSGSRFTGDISKWNVSNVVNMDKMFYKSIFNGNIQNWNVSNVETMHAMFAESPFIGNISKWNVSKSLMNLLNGENAYYDRRESIFW
jgi:hypothetical protein